MLDVDWTSCFSASAMAFTINACRHLRAVRPKAFFLRSFSHGINDLWPCRPLRFVWTMLSSYAQAKCMGAKAIALLVFYSGRIMRDKIVFSAVYMSSTTLRLRNLVRADLIGEKSSAGGMLLTSAGVCQSYPSDKTLRGLQSALNVCRDLDLDLFSPYE